MYKRVCDGCDIEQEVNRYREVEGSVDNWLAITREESIEYNEEDGTAEVIVEAINYQVCSPACGIDVLRQLI